jgi:hypothetical protein
MVRHKKDNFSRGGKKFNPRPKPVPRGNEDTEGAVSSRPPYKAACWDMGHCDPKRCSGKRLMKLGLMRDLHIGQRHPGVIISYVSHRIFLGSHTNDPRPVQMQSGSFLLQTRSLWNNTVLQSSNALGCASRKCLGRGLAESAKDCVCAPVGHVQGFLEADYSGTQFLTLSPPIRSTTASHGV